MTERLLDVSPSAQTRALLRAGRGETSPDRFSERLLVSLGVAAAASVVTSSAAAALATSGKLGGTISGAAASSVAAPSLALVAAKWVAVGVLGGTILAAGAELSLSPKSGPASASVARSRSPQPSDRPQRGPALAPAAAADATPASSAPSAERGNPPTPPAAASSATRAGQLGREVDLIDRVRRALAAGNTSLALTNLDAYSRVASTGVLDREARVLRIQALRDAGDVAAARELAAKYLADFPSDAHSTRLRAQDRGLTP